MTKRVLFWGIAGFLVLASGGFAQYTMDLTGVGDGAVADGVYVSPYQGSIWAGAYSGTGPAPTSPALYSGYVICDDFTDESFVGDVWNATATNAADETVGGTELFNTGAVQQNYDAVAYLANQLVLLNGEHHERDSSDEHFVRDLGYYGRPDLADPDGGATGPTGLIAQAFAAVQNGYVGSNVTVFTPAPKAGVGDNVSQEFLVVNGPSISAPEPASAAVTGL